MTKVVKNARSFGKFMGKFFVKILQRQQNKIPEIGYQQLGDLAPVASTRK